MKNPSIISMFFGHNGNNENNGKYLPRTVNQGVVGSSPTGGAIENNPHIRTIRVQLRVVFLS